ncbi:hypothetical protein Bint_0705 [Brachyspira intermedia PWS/A]|uniref:Lipoprotein n=1 Tax=Brachyspira intermedia (strain ATCC 51140 / PWS/A) TaxID=1045858 RepID=G0EKE6_BRAIP|nr:hypothetical protein Bint_0705 [Brachyspira intermedia PWS/A]
MEIILKKIFTLFSLIILTISLSSCAAKVHLINDTFYGQKVYQTDYISMSYWSETIKFRLKSANDPNNIILEAQYIADSSFNISDANKIVLKFSDNTYLILHYTSFMPKTESEIIYGTSIYFMDTAYVDRSYSINAENTIKEMKVLTDIRVETADGFKNLKVKKDAANDLIRLYNEMQEAISKNK